VRVGAGLCCKQTHLGSRPPIMDSRLVLPLPEGPISASSSPGRQQPVTLCRICRHAASKQVQHRSSQFLNSGSSP